MAEDRREWEGREGNREKIYSIIKTVEEHIDEKLYLYKEMRFNWAST